MNKNIDQFAPYEKTSLTYELLSVTNGWLQEARQDEAHLGTKFLGHVVSRTVNFLITPLTNTIDAAAKIIFGSLELVFALGDHCRKEPFFPSITFAGALATLESGFKHVPSIIFTPLIGAINPEKALKTFHGYQHDRTSELETTLKTLQDNQQEHTAELENANQQLHEENEMLRETLLKLQAESNLRKTSYPFTFIDSFSHRSSASSEEVTSDEDY